MATRRMNTLYAKVSGLIADASPATSPETARDDVAETVRQLGRQTLQFLVAATTAAAEVSSPQIPVPGNGNFVVRDVRFIGKLAAAGYTNYLTYTLSKIADSATSKTTVATWDTQTDSVATGESKAIPITGSAKAVSGGSLIVDLAKTGSGATSNATVVLVEIERADD